jgi:hypothetical protein
VTSPDQPTPSARRTQRSLVTPPDPSTPSYKSSTSHAELTLKMLDKQVRQLETRVDSKFNKLCQLWETRQPDPTTSMHNQDSDPSRPLGPSMTHPGPSMTRPDPSTTHPGPSTTRPHPSTTHPGPSTTRPDPSTTHPGPSTSSSSYYPTKLSLTSLDERVSTLETTWNAKFIMFHNLILGTTGNPLIPMDELPTIKQEHSDDSTLHLLVEPIQSSLCLVFCYLY